MRTEISEIENGKTGEKTGLAKSGFGEKIDKISKNFELEWLEKETEVDYLNQEDSIVDLTEEKIIQ